MTISWNGNQCFFAVEDDTLIGQLNGPLLINEINAAISSADAADISTQYNEGNDKTEATINFNTEPSSSDKTAVESVISAHEGTQSTKDPIKFKNIAEQSTSQSSWQTAWQEELPPLRAGAWQADLSWELKAGSTDLTSGAQVRIVAQKVGESVNEVAIASSLLAQYDVRSVRVPFEAEESDVWQVGFQFKGLGGDTAYIRKMRISVTFDGQNFYGDDEGDS